MSFSYRLKGSLRVHGIPKPNEEVYKNISKMLIDSILSDDHKDILIESTLCLHLTKTLKGSHCLVHEGVCEKGELFILFSDVDLKGFSSLNLESPLPKLHSYVKSIHGNVISPNRQHQIRLVFEGKLTIAPFELKHWDEATESGFIPIIPPLPGWYRDIKLNTPLSKSLKDREEIKTKSKSPGPSGSKFMSILGRK